MAKFSFNLADVNGNNGFNIDASFVSSTFFNRADFNGDGIEDLIVSGSVDPENFGSTETYLIYGQDNETFPANFDLADINGSNGIRITNENDENALTLFGGVVNINGDELSDLSLEFSVDISQAGSPDDLNDNTSHYLIFGDRNLPANLDVSDLDGNNGFKISSEKFDVSGLSGRVAVDVNDDGINDFLLNSTPLLNFPDFSDIDPDFDEIPDFSDFSDGDPAPNYVIFGREEAFPANFNVDTLDGTDGFTIINSSLTVASASPFIDGLEDINADGIDDLIITNFNPLTPVSHIVFGKENFSDTVDLANLNGSNGLTIKGLTPDETIIESDFFVSSYNDLNGDGVNEIIISESTKRVTQEDDDPQQVDTFYFIYGDENLPANIDLSTLTLEEDEGFSFSFSLDNIVNKEELDIEDSFSFGDINNDGFIDVLLNGDAEEEELEDLYVVFGDKNGFESNIDLTKLDGSNGFVLKNTNGSLISYINFFDGDILDFNGDGINDLVVDNFDAESDTTYILFGNEGNFPATIDLLNPNTNAVAISRPDSETGGIVEILDINNDKFDDLVFLLSDSSDNNITTTNTVVFGSDRFSSGNGTPKSNDSLLDISDFNNDDNTDLVWRNQATGQTILWLMDGTAKDTTISLDTAPDSNWELQALADFNKDDNSDLLWRNKATGKNVIWYMDGTEKSDNASVESVSNLNFDIKGAGDFDGDGNADLIWRDQTTAKTLIWYMEGATKRESDSLAEVPNSDWDIKGVGDFNQDGYDDLVWRNGETGQTSIWYMEEETKIDSTPVADVPDLDWKLEGVSDFNGDGNPDLLWRNYDTGSNRLWYMEGAVKNDSASLDSVANSDYTVIL